MIKRGLTTTVALLCIPMELRAAAATEPVHGAAPASQPAAIAAPLAGPDDLSQLSLDDLMNVRVTSVSKQVQKISEAPAAITVIGPDDIQNSGLNSIPELLRLVPGMDVQQVNANRWAITSRGLNGLFADDLLVLVDGRSVYTPVFGGVRWNAVDYPLADLDRIEAIRGPGATLWGSNAVNGVINIQTKSAQQTQGWSLESRLSTDQSEQSARYGGQIDDHTFYRVYEKAGYTDSSVTAANEPAYDYWSSYQAGFRIDRQSTPQDALTFQGDGYYQQLADTSRLLSLEDHTDHESGGNINGRWTHTESDQASTTVQMYYDRQNAEDLPAPYQQDTYNIDFQNRLALGRQQEITWGLGARDTEIRFSESFRNEFSQRHWSDYLYNGFAQDQITLVPGQLQLYIGTKVEYGKLVQFQVQPGARLLWTPDQKNTLWAAVSRSVRDPSLFQEEDVNLGGFMSNHKHLDAEQCISYEAGYKVQPAPTVTADVTAFYNSYRDLINYVPTFTGGFPSGVLYDNRLAGKTYGTELSVNWQVKPEWRVGGSYSLLRTEIRPMGAAGIGVIPTIIRSVEGSAPENQFQLHSYMEIARHVMFNTSLYYVDALPTLNSPPLQSQKVESHVRLDLNVAWQARENLTFSVGVQNLLQNRHTEFGNFNSDITNTQVQRAFYAQCAWTF